METMERHITCQSLYGLILMLNFFFLPVVSENMTIQETSTSLFQQIYLTTLSQITKLESHCSTVKSKGLFFVANDYMTSSYSFISSPLERTTAQKLKTLMTKATTFASEVSSTSATIPLPTKSMSIGATNNNSRKATTVPSSENTSTIKMVETMITETFHPNMATNFPSTSRFIKNSITQTSVFKSQPSITKRISLSSSTDSLFMPTTSSPRYRSTDSGAQSISTASTADGADPVSRVEQTFSTMARLGAASAIPRESALISTFTSVVSAFPRNQKVPTLATTDAKIALTVHLVTFSTRPCQTISSLRTAKAKSTSTNVQAISSSGANNLMFTSVPENISGALSSVIFPTFTRTQSPQPGINYEPTHRTLSPGIAFAPTVGEHMITLNSVIASIAKASESDLTSRTANMTTWTSRPDQTSMKINTLLTFMANENFTSKFHGSTTNSEYLSSATNIINLSETSTASEAITTTDATAGKYTIALSKLTSPRSSNFSAAPQIQSVTNMPKFKLTTLLLKTNVMPTVVASELSSLTKRTIIPAVGVASTLTVKQSFPTKESTSEITQTETNDASVFADITVLMPKSTTTKRLNATMTKKTTSPYLKGKSAKRTVTEVSALSTVLETTGESAQMLTSITDSPCPDTDMSTIPSDDESSPTKVEGNWLSTKWVVSNLDMMNARFSRTLQTSSHKTNPSAEIPLGTPPVGNPASSRTSGKLAFPSQDLSISALLYPDKENTSAFSVHTPRTMEVVVSSTLEALPILQCKDTSFVDTTTSRTIRISKSMNINTTLSDFLSLRTQPGVILVASSISESTRTFPKPFSQSTIGLSNSNFIGITTDGVTAALYIPNASTAAVGEASKKTYIPTYQMSSLPVNVTALISKQVTDTTVIPMTKSSKITHLGCLKSPTIDTSAGPMSEKTLKSVNGSTAISPNNSSTGKLFSTLLPSVIPSTTMTTKISALDFTSVAYVRSTSKGTMASSACTASEMTEVPFRIMPTSPYSTELIVNSVKTIPVSTVDGIVTALFNITASSVLSTKNTDISSIPKTSFSTFKSTIQYSSTTNETSTEDILPEIVNSPLSTMNNGRMTDNTSTYCTMAVPENVFSPTASDNLHTSLNTQVSPTSRYLISFNRTPGSIKCMKAIISTTEKLTLIENTFKAQLPKIATSMNTPIASHSFSWASSFYLPHTTETENSTTKTSFLPTFQMVELPFLVTRVTSCKTQSLPMTLWNIPTNKDSQLPVSTTTHAPTSSKVETETLYLAIWFLSTFTDSQMGPISIDVKETPSIITPGIFPRFGFSDDLFLATSSRTNPITLADFKNIFEKITTSGTPGTAPSSNSSGAIARSINSTVTTSSALTSILFSFSSASSLTTVFNVLHVITSKIIEGLKSTFRTSEMIPTYSFNNFTTLPFVRASKMTPTPTMDGIATGLQVSLPMLMKVTNDSVFISTSPEASSRTTETANSRTLSQFPFISGKSISSSVIDYTLSIGSTHLPSPTITSAWSRIPAISASLILILSKFTLDSPINIATIISTAIGPAFPLISTGVTHNSIPTVSPIVSPSFGTTWMDSMLSSPSTKALISPLGNTVSFYNVGMRFSLFGEKPRIFITTFIHEIAEDWLNSVFQDSGIFLANLAIQIKDRNTSEEEMAIYKAIREAQGMATVSHVPYSCVCHAMVKANTSPTPRELIGRIRGKTHVNLTCGNFMQDKPTLLVKSEDVAVKQLELAKCKAEETASRYKGTCKWLLTNPTETAHSKCIKNEDEHATGSCSFGINIGKSRWDKLKFKQCELIQGLPDKILDLANITVTDENANEVAEHILNLINESPSLDEEETKVIVSKVSDISLCDEISVSLTQIVLQIVNAVMEKQNDSTFDLHEVSNEILRLIERVGHKIEFQGRTENLSMASLALAVVKVGRKFEGLTFSICSHTNGTDPEISIADIHLGRILASIYLPKSLKKRLPPNNLQTILFNFFGQTSLFKTKNVSKALSTYVVSASISDLSIQNLAEPVVITLQHIEGNQNYDQVHCVFWDFEKNNGLGGWNSSGCKVKETNANYTICQCDHLTHFGVLVDLSRSTVDTVNERILVLITHTGCGISSIFLGIAMMTYIVFHKLRKDFPSKILINLCTALLMLNLAFLANSWLSSFQKVGICITAAVALHYFLLASLSWMGLEAVHMYFALVKVFNIYIRNYILKFCLVGWGTPAIIVAITLSVRKNPYGTLSPETPFCWIKDDSIFYVSVVGYFCLIFLVNFFMFCAVLAQLNSVKLQSRKTRRKTTLRDFKGTTSLMFLLGLTWGFAFFAWGPVRIFFLYLFATFNTFQGFLIFIFYCIMKESVREQWQMHLCNGRWRLDNFFDGRNRLGINIKYKQKRVKKILKQRLMTPSVNSTASSSTFKSLDSAQSPPSEISFPSGDFGEDHHGCEVVPRCAKRILPADLKVNSSHKERCFSINPGMDIRFPPTLNLGKVLKW